MSLRELLITATEPHTIFWVDADMTTASNSIRKEYGDLIKKESRSSEAVFTLKNGSRIIAATRLSPNRIRGLSPDAVYIADEDSYEKLKVGILFSTVGKKQTWWFNSGGEIARPE